MKQRIKATHFIEQYNTMETAHEFITPEQNCTPPLLLSSLDIVLAMTKSMTFRHTVAIWKIKAKTLSTNEC